jgi:hypothetical protein
MKPLILFPLLVFFCLLGFQSIGQSGEDRQLGLPGDNLNLYAVIKLFQESPTLEGFEKSLNDQSLKINNLDLDGDNQIDYILVDDNITGDVHNIVLKVAVSKDEFQNVAVIAVQKDNAGNVQMQLIGDEDLYGKDYIVEPNYEETPGETPNPGYTGNTVMAENVPVTVERTTPVQVAAWPVIRFIFVPGYTSWYSPWRWGYYPTYWRPWKPYYWHYYYGYHYHWDYYYFGHYRRWPSYRVPGWRNTYYSATFRYRSVIVQTRVNKGNYRQTYSKPQMARDGAATFKKDFPKAPSVNAKLPSFDKTGRPVISKPVNPGTTRPVVTKPVTKPVQPVTRPVTRPVTKPVQPVTRPVTKPVQPVTRPVQPYPRPVTKPVQPVTRPVTKPVQPVTRPAQPSKGQ